MTAEAERGNTAGCREEIDCIMLRLYGEESRLLRDQKYYVYVETDCAEPSGHYMYRQFNIQQFYVLPTHCIYVFCVDLRTNSDYFPIQH